MPFPPLPLEILQQIAGCVETAHRPSLFTFSLTSRTCRRASLFLIFRQVNITVHHREALRRDVDKFVEALSRTDSARHVQCISIKGDIRLNGKKTDSDPDSEDCWWRSSGLNEIMVDWDPMRTSRHYVVYDEPVIKKSSEEDMAWAPVVSLLQAIPHLKDLVYDCKSQFPPSLLSILHEQHPQCRLHHLSFRFRTLLWGVPYPYEMELATSPSLYRVKLYCTWRDSDYDDDFNGDAILELAAGLAPNLKEVTVVEFTAYRSGRDFRPRGSWQGLPGFTGETLGSLTSLSLNGLSLGLPEVLQRWARHTDFACLQHLTLDGDYKHTARSLNGETMEWIAQNHSFPRLRTLSVSMNRDDAFHERPHYSENAVSFFRAFDSLEELSIHGPMDFHIMDTVLSHHGKTLRKLFLRPLEASSNWANGRDRRDIPMEFSKNDFLQIQAQCPVLEDLSIPVKRNRSSASEAEMYRCFAEMRNLRCLFLILDCSNWRISRDSTYNPQFYGEDQELVNRYNSVKKGVVRETFINCAVDEALARSIWMTISQNKTGRQLERLKLWTTGGGEYGGEGLTSFSQDMVKVLSRSWLIERNLRDDQEGVTVRELGKRGREISDSSVSNSSESGAGQVFRTIWPCKEDSKDWRDDWSSFPLQV